MSGKRLILAALVAVLASTLPAAAAPDAGLLARYPFLDDCVLHSLRPAMDTVTLGFDCGTSSPKYELLGYAWFETRVDHIVLSSPFAYDLREPDGSYTRWNDPAMDGLDGDETMAPTAGTGSGA